MKLPRIDSAIAACTQHIQDTNAGGTLIEAYLAEYLLVIMCSAFEEHIVQLVYSRIAQANDPAVLAFVKSAKRQLFQSPQTRNISTLLGRFGDTSRVLFQQEMLAKKRAETFFNNIVVNRHSVVHPGRSQASFGDVIQFYEEGHVVLDSINLVLSRC